MVPFAAHSSLARVARTPESESKRRPYWLVPFRLLHFTYKHTLSLLLGPRCRFYPTCSDYALQALEVHGPVRGGGLAIRRVMRCNPWCEGGIDHVPAKSRAPRPTNQATN